MTAYPLLTLWRAVQTDDEQLARQIRAQAIREGATALQVARAWADRDARLAEQVQVVGGGR